MVDDEIKSKILAALEAKSKTAKELSAEHGVPVGTIKSWVARAKVKKSAEGMQPSGQTGPGSNVLALNATATLDNWPSDPAEQTRRAYSRLCQILAVAENGEHLRKDFGITFGIVADKMLVFEGKASSITRTESTSARIDVTQLTLDQIKQFAALERKLNNDPAPPLAYDPAQPVVYSETDAEPPAWNPGAAA